MCFQCSNIMVTVTALQSKEDPNAALRSGSLQDIYEMSQVSERTHWVNMLDVPLGETSVPVPPQYRCAGRFNEYWIEI